MSSDNSLPPEIATADEGHAGAYLDLKSNVTNHNRAEVKLILVGNGGAGKTSLSRRLRGEGFSDKEPATEGINVTSMHQVVVNQGVRVNMWDFGGQEILHSTHQLFLSSRGFYIIVLDARTEVRPDYWLEVASAFGGDSPILIVINKSDVNPSFYLDERNLRENFKNVVGICRVSCRTGEGVDEIKALLQDAISKSPYLNDVWPASWSTVRNTVEQTNKDYLDLDEFSNICIGVGIENPTQQEQLLRLLHDMGIVVYFPEVALQVLNPNWLTNAIYKIINSRAVLGANGILDRGLLKDLLVSDGGFSYNANERRAVLELMKRFELCYEVSEGLTLIPSLLSPRQPDFEFNFHEAAHVRFAYSFLPSSVMPRLMVRMNSYVEQNLRWRNGAVLATLAARALVQCNSAAGELDVFLIGADRWQLFETIRKQVLEINSNLDGLAVSEVVPCICDTCNRYRRPHLYYLSTLVSTLENGVDSVKCERSYDVLRIAKLIPEHPMAHANSFLHVPQERLVFISYASLDAKEIGKLVADMKAMKIPYWLDLEQIRPGDSITSKINDGLARSNILVACISQNQLKSGWARAEYGSALGAFLSGRSKRVIPLLLDGTSEETLPAVLRDLRAVKRQNDGDYRVFLEDLVEP